MLHFLLLGFQHPINYECVKKHIFYPRILRNVYIIRHIDTDVFAYNFELHFQLGMCMGHTHTQSYIYILYVYIYTHIHVQIYIFIYIY